MQNYTPIDELMAKLNAPVSGPTKEVEPLTKINEPLKIHEITEHKEIDESLKNHLEIKKENVELSPELKNVGVEAVETSSFQSQKPITLPLSDEKILIGIHKPITSSLKWLATLAMYMLKQAHMTLKVVHGKVIRQSY